MSVISEGTESEYKELKEEFDGKEKVFKKSISELKEAVLRYKEQIREIEDNMNTSRERVNSTNYLYAQFEEEERAIIMLKDVKVGYSCLMI